MDKNMEYRLNKDNSANSNYVDVLEEDKPMAGQKFVCISFISPDKILKEKKEFFYEEFLKQWDMAKSLEKFTQFLNFLSFKYNLSNETLNKDLEEFVKEEREKIFTLSLQDEFKTFIDKHENKLEEMFNKKFNFQTNVRGIKVRGSFPSQSEAELRAKLLRELDANHDVFVGPVGLWMPFDPEAYKTGRVEYLEDELNQLMHEKNKNEEKAKEQFDERVKEAKKQAIEDNKSKALESGNKLTQTLDEEGNLINVKDATTFGLSNEGVTSADIRKELFESGDIVKDDETDHGASQLSNKKI
jgi:hypothetical protein